VEATQLAARQTHEERAVPADIFRDAVDPTVDRAFGSGLGERGAVRGSRRRGGRGEGDGAAEQFLPQPPAVEERGMLRALVGALERGEDGREQGLTGDRTTLLQRKAGRRSDDLGRVRSGIEIDVDPDTDEGELGRRTVPFRFDQDAGELLALEAEIVRPFDAGV